MSAHLATVVVTDLVSSTKLRAALGEEAADQLHRLHARMLREVAEANGGTVVKGLGDGVLARFGGAADGDLLGTPVIEAARLCGAARGGQILAAALVPQLAHGRGGVACDPVGELELKGIPVPVAAVEVRWSATRALVALVS